MITFYYTVLVLFFSVLIISPIYSFYYTDIFVKSKNLKPRKNICPDNWSYVEDLSDNYCQANEIAIISDTLGGEYTNHTFSIANNTQIDLFGKLPSSANDTWINDDTYRYYFTNDCNNYLWATKYDINWTGYSNLPELDFCPDPRNIKESNMATVFKNHNDNTLYKKQMDTYPSQPLSNFWSNPITIITIITVVILLCLYIPTYIYNKGHLGSVALLVPFIIYFIYVTTMR
jgi:hypothetical protein